MQEEERKSRFLNTRRIDGGCLLFRGELRRGNKVEFKREKEKEKGKEKVIREG